MKSQQKLPTTARIFSKACYNNNYDSDDDVRLLIHSIRSIQQFSPFSTNFGNSNRPSTRTVTYHISNFLYFQCCKVISDWNIAFGLTCFNVLFFVFNAEIIFAIKTRHSHITNTQNTRFFKLIDMYFKFAHMSIRVAKWKIHSMS